MSETLHMVQLQLDARAVMRSARRQGLPRESDDLGYVLHGQLAALFGELAPKPFFARAGDRRRDVEVLGYTHADESTLRRHLETFSEPSDEDALQHLAVKTMPGADAWQEGRRLGFELRACPVVRSKREKENRRAGSEVDAFLAACDRAGAQGDGTDDEKISRAQVYREWLEPRLGDAARLESLDLHRFRRIRLYRRSQGAKRVGAKLERPDVIFRGELRVLDGGAFARLLAHGVGRHRAFGFGMLLLRPPGTGAG